MQAFLVDPKSDERYDAVVKLVELMYKPHIYKALCNELKHLYYAHEVFREIEDGKRIVIFTVQDNVITGCVHGVIDDGIFTVHIMFQRKVDAVDGCFLAEKAMIEYCRSNNIPFTCVRGHICAENKAALRCALRWGAENKGISDHMTFWQGEEHLPCYVVEKRVEL